MTFPGAHAQVHYNEAGEVTGWDYPEHDDSSFYCDMCGFCHAGPCADDEGED